MASILSANVISNTTIKCVKCGYCCTVGPCLFGTWDEQKKQCSFLTEKNECSKYAEINRLPGSIFSPAFGMGCSSSIGNLRRIEKLKTL